MKIKLFLFSLIMFAIFLLTRSALAVFAFGVAVGWCLWMRALSPRRTSLLAAALLFAPFLLMPGCTLRQIYPETKIAGYLGGKPLSIQAPKDSTLVGFDATVDTNGAIHLHIDRLDTSLNPTNLAQAGNSQATIVTATGDAVVKAFAAGGAAAGAAAGAIIKTP